MGEMNETLMTVIGKRAAELYQQDKHPSVVLMTAVAYQDLLREAGVKVGFSLGPLMRGSPGEIIESHPSMGIQSIVSPAGELRVVLVFDTVEQFEVF